MIALRGIHAPWIAPLVQQVRSVNAVVLLVLVVLGRKMRPREARNLDWGLGATSRLFSWRGADIGPGFGI